MRRTTGALILVVASLFIAACGSSSSSSPSASAPSSSSSNSPYSGGAASSPTSSARGHTRVTTKQHSKLGPILAAGSKKLTVYVFAADKTSMSTCTGACAAAWPPVIEKGTPVALAGAMSSELGTTTRPGGVKQLTYAGHPLYYFVKDKDNGDAYGQGVHAFGAGWYAIAPSGKKVDNS